MTNKRNFGFAVYETQEHTNSVAEVFDTASTHYDLLNDAMSLGLHRLWKKAMIKRTLARANESWLDMSCGSGDISKLLLERDCQVTAVDPNAKMLATAKEKLAKYDNLNFLQCFAEEIPLENNLFDGITCAFGLRNFSQPKEAIKEMTRVLKPGGRLVVLEFSKPNELIKDLHHKYLLEALPALGKAIANDEDSYRYLGESILTHPQQEEVAAWFEAAKLTKVTWLNLNLGIVAIHRGWKVL